MVINQELIDNIYIGLTEYVSFLSDMYLNMILSDDVKKRRIETKLMYLINIKRSLRNYGYSTEFFTDDELAHLIEEVTIVTDELPNNSIYVG